MLGWLRPSARNTARIKADADALGGAFGIGAYAEARRREREAEGPEAAQHWGRVALTIAQETGKRIGVDTARRAGSADFDALLAALETLPARPSDSPNNPDEFVRLASERGIASGAQAASSNAPAAMLERLKAAFHTKSRDEI